jgi:hypothetical protein
VRQYIGFSSTSCDSVTREVIYNILVQFYTLIKLVRLIKMRLMKPIGNPVYVHINVLFKTLETRG